MTDIRARSIAHSISDLSPWLWTAETRAPCMVHQEVLRHRRIITEEGLSVLGLGWEPDFSFSVSSTRAVPFAKMLEECRDPALAAAPVHWGTARKGMVPGEEMDDTDRSIWWPSVVDRLGLQWVDFKHMWSHLDADLKISRRECAKRIWELHGAMSALHAEVMVEFCDPHKSIPNRMMQPHLHYNVLMTGTEPGWMNFMGLRLDGAADPIVRALAEQCWIALNESQPNRLHPGEWHLPYADDAQSEDEAGALAEYPESPTILDLLKKMSMARCAHLSFTSFETGERMTVEQCLKVVSMLNLDRSRPGPIHASPAEHQATPDLMYDWQECGECGEPAWENPHKGGNLGPGWIQLRKTIPGEAIAPLPEGYRLGLEGLQ